jgi:hypothetical protein
MPRIDDYKQARALAVDKLKQEPAEDVAARAGLDILDNGDIRIPFLNRVYRLNVPEYLFSDSADADQEVPIQEQIIILHYLTAETTPAVTGKWVAYREIPGASFYFSAFVKRAIDPLKKVFGRNAAGLQAAADKLGAKKIAAGDIGLQIDVFPSVPLQLILWEGDDEFEPEGNILFDASVGQMLSPEDVAWLAGMVVYRLIALSKE